MLNKTNENINSTVNKIWQSIDRLYNYLMEFSKNSQKRDTHFNVTLGLNNNMSELRDIIFQFTDLIKAVQILNEKIDTIGELFFLLQKQNKNLTRDNPATEKILIRFNQLFQNDYFDRTDTQKEDFDTGDRERHQQYDNFKPPERATFNSPHAHRETANLIKIYFAVPEIDGSFIASNRKHQPDNKTVFELILKNSYIAEVGFVKDDILQKKAINAFETYLEKVINDVYSTFTTSAEKIVVIEPGIYKLNGDKWVLEKKIKVKFE